LNDTCAVHGDGEISIVRHSAQFCDAKLVLSRNVLDAGKRVRRAGDNGARAAFAEERGFRRSGCGDLRSRRKSARCETTFGQRDGEASVADVVRGAEQFLAHERKECLNQALFRREIHGGRSARDNSMKGEGVFRGRKLALGSGAFCVRVISRAIKKQNCVAFILKRNADGARCVFEKAEYRYKS
jgi:hypothetical protein